MSQSREGYLWTASSITEGLPTESFIADSNGTTDNYDVIVIGAGFAGLVAARDISLLRPHDKILLVEGRDRIGGRTWTAKALGEEFEMGGTWVHWNQPHVYSEIVRYGLHRNLKTSAGTSAAAKSVHKFSGKEVQEVDGAEVNAVTERLAVKFFGIDGYNSQTLLPWPHDPLRGSQPWTKYDHLSVKQRLDQLSGFSEDDKELFECLASTLGSAPSSEIGFVEMLRWYALGGHNMAQMFELCGVYKLGYGGTTSLARAILADFKGDVLSNTVICKIDQLDGRIQLSTTNGAQLVAHKVICTVPLNCLSDVVFSPPMTPLRQEAASRGHINKGAKIHFKLSKPEPGWFGTCNSSKAGDSSFLFAFSDHNGTKSSGHDGTYCIGFGYNDYLQDKKDSEHIISEFEKSFRPSSKIEAYLTHDWMNDPLAKGVWSCWSPNAMSQYLEELQKPHGNVFFASADWANGWRGFIDGAIESGHKAAHDLNWSMMNK